MMKWRPEKTLQDRAREAGNYAYAEIVPVMSRSERRSMGGKLLIAQGEIARLKAENEALREAMKVGE